MYKIVLIRHGESVWNLANRFTGWIDIDLTAKGMSEAKEAANLLKKAGFVFTMAYTSVLKRAIRTLWIILDNMNLMWVPIKHDWRLNERHYGALQGLNKKEIIQQYGEDQVLIWRRSYRVRPISLTCNNTDVICKNSCYTYLKNKPFVPLSESLHDTFKRVVVFWKEFVKPSIYKNEKVMIVAHGNSLRALIKYLDNISDDKIVHLNVPNAQPLIYELDACLHPIKSYYLTN